MPRSTSRAFARPRLLGGIALALGVLGVHLWLLDRPVQTRETSAPTTIAAVARAVSAPLAGDALPRAAAMTTTVRAAAPLAEWAGPATHPAPAAPATPPAQFAAASGARPPALRRAAPSQRASTPPTSAASAAPATPSTTATTSVTSAAASEPMPAQNPSSPPRAAPRANTCPPTALAHLPTPVLVRYSLKRGRLQGEGVLDWRWDAGHYSLRLEGQVPLIGTLLLQRSEGGFDACGLAPLRHTERRLGRSERAVSFVRHALAAGDAGAAGASERPPADELRFSNNARSQPLQAGTQDRLSWLVQLATRLGGWPGGLPPAGEHLALDVAAVGGDVQHWVFTVVGRDERGWMHLRREADDPFDTRAEVWTDPQRQHWPVRVELREARGDPLVLQLTTWQPAGR